MRWLLLAAAVLLAACGDDGSSDPVPSTSTEGSAAATAPPTPATEATTPTSSTEAAATTADPVSEATTSTPEVSVGAGEVQRLVPEVLATTPRSTEAFTQGLEAVDGRIIESSGLYERSFLRLVDPDDWTEIARVELPDTVFAEGATVVEDRVIVLSWREESAFVYDLDGLDQIGELPYLGEGWGLCELDDGRLAMSNGSSDITFRDPDDFSELGVVAVTLEGNPIDRLNELECVGDDIWANVWQTEQILRIDAATGTVEAVVEADGLIEPDPSDDDPDDVLNGIAHLGDDRFLITGKRWPVVFEVRFVVG